MTGSRSRRVWCCRACRQKFTKRRAWTDHMWMKHQIAVLRKVRRRNHAQARAPHRRNHHRL